MPTRAGVLRSTFDRCSAVVVAITGLDGLVEAVAGLVTVTAPAIGGRLLVALDVLVIAPVSWEYERLRRERAARLALARAHPAERTSSR